MLKIKDNVDLKELEKFRYEYNEYGLNYVKESRNKKGSWVFIIVDIKTRYIKKHIHKIGTHYNIPLNAEDVFDIIQANLVEKVVE